ncbi:MAG: hypothetical protein DRI65_07375 [Chloroflexota bacterium]|nr:MAG: hypothetical protein DRI65_07375 [Chloroflexota bacterium]
MESSPPQKYLCDFTDSLAGILDQKAEGQAVYSHFTCAKEFIQLVSFTPILLLMVAGGGAADRKQQAPPRRRGELGK